MKFKNPFKMYMNYRDRKFRDKMDKYFLSVERSGGQYMKPNVLYSNLVNRFNTDREFSKLLFEQIMFYQSNPDQLRYFYTNEVGKFITGIYGDKSNRKDYFWSQDGDDIVRKTSGLAPLIAETYANLLYNAGYEIEIENGNKADYERLDNILNKNDFHNMIKEVTETESYAGYACIKMIIDQEIDDQPILELVPPENVEVVTKYGRIIKIIFKKHFFRSLGEQKTKQYELHEAYMPGMIRYNLYEVEKNREDQFDYKEVSLGLFEDTKDLKDIEISDGTMLAFFKKNKSSSHMFRGSVYSESDIASSLSTLDAIDETLSLLISEQRDGKLVKIIPENRIPVNQDGVPAEKYSTFKNWVITAADLSEGVENKIQWEKPETNILQYLDTLKTLTEKAINNAGLNVTSCGLTGYESINSSDASQKEREKVSIRSRNNKLKLHKAYLENLFETLLRVDDMMNNRKPKDYNVNVSFNDYIKSSIEDRIKTASEAITSGIMSIERAIELLYGDELSDEEKQLEVIKIKMQNQYENFSTEELELMIENGLISNEQVEEPEENIEDNLEEPEED